MIAKLFELKETENKGKALFAKQFIPKGTVIIFECPDCKIYSPDYPDGLSDGDRKHFFKHAYQRDDLTYCMACDETIYLNHSCDSNILWSGFDDFFFDIVVRDIQPGEEATYDYRVFYNEPCLLRGDCQCGSPNCCQKVECIRPIPEDLKSSWQKKVKPALAEIIKVHQPLKEIIISTNPDAEKYFT
jgi:SET domain-containing protein